MKLKLTKAENRVYKLIRKEYINSIELSKILNINLSTIQKHLTSLFKKDLLIRRQCNLYNGGFVYFYKRKSLFKCTEK